MNKIEEYFLAPCTLKGARRIVSDPLSDPQRNWAEVGVLWDEVLTKSDLSPTNTLRFGLMETNADGTISYFASVMDRPELPDGFDSFVFEGGYYLFAEHVGGCETLNRSVEWFYSEYLPSAPYDLRSGPRLQLLDARFSQDGPESVLSFGLPVTRKQSS